MSKEQNEQQLREMQAAWKSEYEKSFQLANLLNQRMLGQYFTIRKMNRMTSFSLSECQAQLNYLSSYCLVKIRKRPNSDAEYKIVLDAETRLSGIKQLALELSNRFTAQMAFYESLEQQISIEAGVPAELKVVN